MIEKKQPLDETVKKIIEDITIKNSNRSGTSRDEVLSRITSSISSSEKLSKNKFRIALCSSAAAIVACIVVYTTYTTNTQKTEENQTINYTEIAKSTNSQSKEVTICMNNEPAIEVKNNSTIDHTTQGETKIDSHIIVHENIENYLNKISQVVVPKSKRAEVLLSDGTRVTLNSDSRIIYATNFNSHTREIYIEGEAFLDVAKDENKPFIVKTKKFTVNVTGTRFNVNSYNDDTTSSVVLVEGSVNIDIENKNKMHLDPGQIIEIDNQHAKIEYIDTYKYTCWMDKIMIFENQTLKEVSNKVARFYDIDIVIDQAHSNMKINGKLDLKDNAEEVIKTLAIISNLNISKISNTITLTD